MFSKRCTHHSFVAGNWKLTIPPLSSRFVTERDGNSHLAGPMPIKLAFLRKDIAREAPFLAIEWPRPILNLETKPTRKCPRTR